MLPYHQQDTCRDVIFKLTPIYAQFTEFLFHFGKLPCLPARQLGVQRISFIITTQKSFKIQSLSVKSGNYLRRKIIHCTTCKRSCWKVMIPVVSVCLQGSSHGMSLPIGQSQVRGTSPLTRPIIRLHHSHACLQWQIYIVKFWMRAPLGVQILSISCSFWEILAKSYVGTPPGSWRPHLREILDPPLVCICTLLLPMLLSSDSVALNCVGVGFNLTVLQYYSNPSHRTFTLKDI